MLATRWRVCQCKVASDINTDKGRRTMPRPNGCGPRSEPEEEAGTRPKKKKRKKKSSHLALSAERVPAADNSDRYIAVIARPVHALLDISGVDAERDMRRNSASVALPDRGGFFELGRIGSVLGEQLAFRPCGSSLVAIKSESRWFLEGRADVHRNGKSRKIRNSRRRLADQWPLSPPVPKLFFASESPVSQRGSFSADLWSLFSLVVVTMCLSFAC